MKLSEITLQQILEQCAEKIDVEVEATLASFLDWRFDELKKQVENLTVILLALCDKLDKVIENEKA